MKRSQANSGHIALYAALLPFILSLVFLVIDVANWNAARDILQNESSTLAQQSAALLPGKDNIQSFVQAKSAALAQQLPHLENFKAGVAFPGNISGSAVQITLSAKYKDTLSTLLNRLSLKHSSSFSIERSTIAQIVPGDYVIIMSDGYTLRPNGAPWGDNNSWPAADLFRCYSAPSDSTNFLGTGESWSKYWTPDGARLATQSCFNPAFSTLKRVTINLTDRLSAHPLNRLSVILTPGNNHLRQYDTIRFIHPQSNDNLTPAGFGTTIQGRASWEEMSYLSSSLVCMQFALPLCTNESSYDLWPDKFSGRSRSNLLNLESSSYGNTLSLLPEIVTDQYYASLPLREAIYFDSAKSAKQSIPNISAGINAGIFDLLSADNKEDAGIINRGNLQSVAHKKIIILSDYLLGLDSYLTANQIKTLNDLQIELHIITFRHNRLDDAHRDRLDIEYAALKEKLASATGIYLYDPANENDLISKILPLIISKFNQVAVRSYE
ncbi:MAG: hypothetical protein IT292_04360 [Deltaproteobacteria bacterium]|nr:hypothetical protein [Deltaproteobacteria bacterium]